MTMPASDITLIERKLEQIHVDLDRLHADNDSRLDALEDIAFQSGPPHGDDFGTASNGTLSYLIDSTKQWPANIWFQGILSVTVSGVVFNVIVSGNTDKQLNFTSPLPVEVLPGSPYKVRAVVSQVASGQIRPGLALQSNQYIKLFSLDPSPILSPFVPWVTPVIPGTGTQTAPLNPTVMTNGAANFKVNSLIGFVIYNITDGSQGVVIANTATTVTVAALTGGTLNVWTPGDAYMFGVHVVDAETGIPAPVFIPQGYTMSLAQSAAGGNQDNQGIIYFDNMFVGYLPVLSSGIYNIYNQVLPVDSAVFDPTAAFAHIADYLIQNIGASDMWGDWSVNLLFTKLGSPPFREAEKEVMCNWCKLRHKIPTEATLGTCPRCGKPTIYRRLDKFKHSS